MNSAIIPTVNPIAAPKKHWRQRVFPLRDLSWKIRYHTYPLFPHLHRIVREDCERRHLRLRLKTSPEDEAIWANTNPLISVIIPTLDRVDILVRRTLPSVFAQTHENLEVLVVGDRSPPQVAEALAGMKEPRLRYVHLTEREEYPPHPYFRWMVAGAEANNLGLRLARGEWIAHLDDDDVLLPHHFSTLLNSACTRRLQFVWSRTWSARDSRYLSPSFPGQKLLSTRGLFAIAHSSTMHIRKLRQFPYVADCWRWKEAGDWNRWRRMARCDVTMGFVDVLSVIHN